MNVCLEMFKITNSNNLMLIATQLTYTLLCRRIIFNIRNLIPYSGSFERP